MRWVGNYRNQSPVCLSLQQEGEEEKPTISCCRERHRISSCTCPPLHQSSPLLITSDSSSAWAPLLARARYRRTGATPLSASLPECPASGWGFRFYCPPSYPGTLRWLLKDPYAGAGPAETHESAVSSSLLLL